MARAALYLIVPLVIAGAIVGGYFAFRAEPPKRVPEPSAPAPDDPPAPPGAPKSDDKPSLVVLVVFDQMRGDYIARWAGQYGPDGFERIKKEGIWFSDCHIPYACTSTGPGHASLSTGAPPSVHGIIENEWYDRKTGEKVYCCQPSRPYELVPPVPTELGKPSRGSGTGWSPERLLAETVGDSLVEATKGAGRVFSLSIKDRTAVLMGGQKPSAVYCFDTRDGRFHTGAYYGRDAVHPWVAEFNNAKPADAWFDATWDRLKPDLDYAQFSGPDDVPAEAVGFNGQGRTFPHPFKGKLTAPAKPYYEAVECSPAGNELLFALVKKAVTAEKLGRGAVPDLLCVSFSSTDLIGHQWGPDSQEVMDITLRADKLVGEFLKFLDEEVGKGRYAMVIAADHGVCPLPELESTKAKYPAATRRTTLELATGLEAALTAMYGQEGATPTRWIEVFDDDTWPWVYLNDRAIGARKLKVDDVAQVARDWLAGRGYIEDAFTRKELEDGQFPADRPFKRPAVLAYRPDRCGAVLVIPKAGVLVTKYKGGTNHGSPQPYDAHVPFLVYGAGVPALGQRTEKVSSLSIAPTLARALGVPPPKQAAVLPPEAIPVRK
jgi:hypothetical protein